MSVSGPETAPAREGLRDFYIFVCAMAAVYVALIWALRFPPMQDYPMRMFIAFAAATFDDPQYNWQQFFELHNNFGSYSFTFWFMRAFAPFVGIEAAGKLFLSLYVVLTGAFALTEAQRRENVPWPLVLLLPLAFNQTYILGLMGYFFSVPVMMLALRHFASVIEEPLTPRRLATHLPFQAVLFLCHPFTSAIYAGFAALAGARRRGRALLRAAVLAGGFSAFFFLWFMYSSTGGGFEFMPRWWPLSATAEYFALMFTGMNITNGADWAAAGLWCAVGGVMAYCLFRARGKFRPARLDTVMLGIAVAGYFTLPFSPGAPYTYFNIRLLAVVYFLGALVLSYIPVSRRAGIVLATVAAALSVQQGLLHKSLSDETGRIYPLIAAMKPNEAVLASVRSGRSEYLDPQFFYQFHDHAPEYYHFLKGGGVPVTLISNPGFPIRYRSGLEILNVRSTDPADYACCFRYIITRADFKTPDNLGPYKKTVTSGRWDLFELPGF